MTKTKKQAKEVSEKERFGAAKKIVEHVFSTATTVQVITVQRLIAEDAEEEDLVNLTSELVAVKTGLGKDASFDDVLTVHSALVEDEDGMQLEDDNEIEEQIELARATLEETFGEEEANKTANLVAYLS